MKLRDLLPEAATDARHGAIDISGVTADSRKVKPGFLFVAIAGARADGAHFPAKPPMPAPRRGEQNPKGCLMPSHLSVRKIRGARLP